jgi:hypothetical protein
VALEARRLGRHEGAGVGVVRHVTAILILLAVLAEESVAQPISLQAAGPWKLDYANASCILSRTFSSAGETYEFQLTLEPVETRAWLRIGSAGKQNKRDDGNAIVEVDGKPLPKPTHFNIFRNAQEGTTREFLFEDFRKDVSGTSKSLRLKPAKYGDFNLAVPDFSDAMRALNSCMDDLHRSLGINPAILKTVAVMPEGWSFQFVKSPGRQFDMKLLYWVTSEGRVDDCRVLAASGIAELDGRVCDELKRKGRFKPARNSAGAAIRAPVYEDIRMRFAERITTSPL